MTILRMVGATKQNF